MFNVNHPTLYQVDSKGKLRFWFMQTEGGKHRTVSGTVGGKEVVSGWVVCEAKNVGRSNSTTPEQQALLEVEADYKLKTDKKYYFSIDEAKKAGSGTKFLSPMLATKWEDYRGDGPDGGSPRPGAGGHMRPCTTSGAILDNLRRARCRPTRLSGTLTSLPVASPVSA